VKIGFVSLGCPKNQVELEKLAGKLKGGLEFTDKPAECDVMLVNTCGFIKDAIIESVETILSMRREMPIGAKLIVMGCMAERYKNEINRELPEADLYVGDNETEKILEYIERLADLKLVRSNDRYLLNSSAYAYLKIAEGCDNRCTYCTIPDILGKRRAFKAEAIVSEAESLVLSGVRELIVVSQDNTKYQSEGLDFAGLMEMLASKFENTYFRLMYLNPDGVNSRLLEIVKTHKNILPYFDIPVQHLSDKVLRSMNRRYCSKDVYNLFDMVKSYLPDVFIRTTLIIGFPGERDDDHKENVEFLKHAKPDYAGFFEYSPESGTPAAGFRDTIDKKTAVKRILELQKIQKRNTVNRLKAAKNSEILCFVECASKEYDFILEGHAAFQAPEIDGTAYITAAQPVEGHGPFRARLKKILYPDIYAELI
jgi:ribosomal protein S12 methylthiotransferase